MVKQYDPSKDLTLTGGAYTPDEWSDTVIPDLPDPNSPIGDVSNFRNNPALLRDIYKVYNARGVHFNNDDEAIDRWYSDMVWSLGNTYSAINGDQGYLTATGIEDEDVRSANNRLRQAYHEMPSFYEEGGMGWGTGLYEWGTAAVTDPTNLLPLGWGAKAARAGYAASKAVGKPTGLIGKRALQGAAGESVLSGGIEAGLEYGTQATDVELGIQDSVDMGRVGQAAGFGAVAGGVFGGLFAAAGAKLTTNQVNKTIERLTRNGWKPEQIAAMVDVETGNTKWFESYAKRDITPNDHSNMPANERVDLGQHEPNPNKIDTSHQLNAPLKYDDVPSRINAEVHNAQQNATTLEADGADAADFINKREYFQEVKRLHRALEAKRNSGELPPEELEELEQLLVDAVNNADSNAHNVKSIDDRLLTLSPAASKQQAQTKIGEPTTTDNTGDPAPVDSDIPPADADVDSSPAIPEDAPLDKDPFISNTIHQWGEGNVENYNVLRVTRGGKAALQKIARELNKSSDERIDPKLSKEELSAAIEDRLATLQKSKEGEALEGLEGTLIDEIDASFRALGFTDAYYDDWAATPKHRPMLHEAIDDAVDDLLDREIDGDWQAAGESLKAKLASDERYKPISETDTLDSATTAPPDFDAEISKLPRKMQNPVRKSIAARIEQSEKLRNMFKGAKGESLTRIIEATRAFYRKTFDIPEDVSRLPLSEVPDDLVPNIIAMRDFSRRAKANKGEGILQDPIFEKIRNRILQDEIEQAQVRVATKGTPGSSSGRIATGIGITPGRARRPTRTNVRRDWNNDGTEGFSSARAKAEITGSSDPVPFLAVKGEKITSEIIQHSRKDGTVYTAPKWSKRKAKLWYDPITKKTWTDENFDEMLVARGEGKQPISDIGGGKVTPATLSKLPTSPRKESPEDSVASNERIERRIADMSDEQVDSRVERIREAFKRKREARAEGKRKTSSDVGKELDPDARVTAVLRRTPTVQGKSNPSGFQTSYFRVESKGQSNASAATIIGAKGDMNEWITGTVPIKYKGATSQKAIEDFVPDDPKDAHIIDRYKVGGFVSPTKSDTPLKPVNFRDVQDEIIDFGDMDVQSLNYLARFYKSITPTAHIDVRTIEEMLTRLEVSWPAVAPRLKGREWVKGDYKQHILALSNLYRIRHKAFPGGIIYGEATRQQSYDQIKNLFWSDQKTTSAVLEIMEHLTRDTNDIAPSFADLTTDNYPRLKEKPDLLGIESNRDKYRDNNPENEGGFTAKAPPANISITNRGLTGGYKPALHITTHEIMHWAYANVLTDNERLYYWENAIRGRTGDQLDADVSGLMGDFSPGNIANSPNEYFAENATAFLLRRMPGALDEKWWKTVMLNTKQTVKQLGEIAGLIRGDAMKADPAARDYIDPAVREILDRVLPDEFKSRMLDTARSQIAKDLQKYKFNRLTVGHANKLLARMGGFDTISRELEDAKNSTDIDRLSISARNLASNLLDSSHEKQLGRPMRRSLISLATKIFEITDGELSTVKTVSQWGSDGRVVPFDETAHWKEGQWGDNGRILVDRERSELDFDDLGDIVDDEGEVVDYESFGRHVQDLSDAANRIMLDEEGNAINPASGEKLDVDMDEADRWLAKQDADDTAFMGDDERLAIEAIFNMPDTENVLRELGYVFAQRWQSAAGITSNKGWIDLIPTQFRQGLRRDEVTGLQWERTDRSANKEKANRAGKKKGAVLRKNKEKYGVTGGYTTKELDNDQLFDIISNRTSDPIKAKDAAREIEIRIVQGKPPAEGVNIPQELFNTQKPEMIRRLAELGAGKTKAERMEIAQIKSEIIRRANNKVKRTQDKPTVSRIEVDIAGRETTDSASTAPVDGIPSLARPHIQETLSRITERTPTKTADARLVSYRIFNIAGLTDPASPITNEHIAKLAGKPLQDTPHKTLADFSNEEFRSFRNQVRTAVKEKDAVQLARFAMRAGLLTPEELSAIKTNFKDDAEFLQRWSSYAKEGNAPLRGVRDESLADVTSAMDSLNSSVAYMMDGISSLESMYGTHPRISDHADPMGSSRGVRARDLSLRLKEDASVSQEYAGQYAKDLLDGMTPREKSNLAAFVSTGMARTASGVTPYFVRSNGEAALLPELGEFGSGVYASTHSKPYQKTLEDIVVQHLNDAEAPFEKVNEAESLASNLSSIREDIAEAKVKGDWYSLTDAGLDELFEIEGRIASQLRKVTGRNYDQVAPIACSCNRYADFTRSAQNDPSNWLISEFMNSVAKDGDAISMSATGNILAVAGREGVDRGRELYKAMWRTLANGDNANEATAKVRVNKILSDMGYDGISFTGEHRSVGGLRDNHTEYVIFDTKKAKKLNDPYFTEEEVLELNPNPTNETIVTPIVRDILEGGDGSTVGVSHTVASSDGTVGRFVDSIRGRGGPSPEDIAEGFRKGPVYFLRKGSARLRKYGDNFISDFLQKENGTGIFERVDNEIGRKIMPIVRALNALPGTGNAVQRWFKRSIDVRARSKPTPSELRVIMALRTGEGRALANAAERRAYQRIRETFNNEKDAMIHYGIMHSGIKENYVPQIWSKESLQRNQARAVEKLSDYFIREARERHDTLGIEDARRIAKKMVRNIIDDDGTHIPPQYATKNDAGLDHVDYQRMIKLHRPEFRQDLFALGEFLENDIGAILAKYLDGSTRKIEFAKRFGQGNHGALMYMRVIEEGKEAAVKALLKPREIRRTIRGVVDGKVETMQRTDQIPAPFKENEFAATQMIDDVIDAIKNRGGIAEANRILQNPELFSFPLDSKKQFQWDRRAEAIVAGLESHTKRGQVAPSEVKVMEDLLMAAMRKPVGDSHFHTAMRPISKFMRNMNALTMLSFTTVTSLTDPFIPLLRSGEVGAWLRGMHKYASDPDYRAMMRDSGLSIENYVHNRLVGLYGADASKLTTAFFNATMLSPWTDSMREMAGIIGFEWFKTEQRRIAKHGLNSRQGRKAKRVLEKYGLGNYARPNSPSIESLVKNRNHIGMQYDEAIDPELVLQSDQMRDALIKFANDTIFAPNTNDIPLWAQTPAGAMVWQLKSFPMMMARLSKDSIMEIVKDPKNLHSYKPLAMLAVMGPAGGAMAISAKDAIQMRGDEEQGVIRDRHGKNISWLEAVGYNPDLHGDPNDFAGWYIEGMMHMGGFGLYLELLHNVVEQADNGMYGYSRAMSNVLGPTFGQTIGAWNTASGLGNLLWGEEGDPNGKGRQAAREVVQRIPVVGGLKAVKESMVDLMGGEKSSGSGRYSGSKYGGSKYK